MNSSTIASPVAEPQTDHLLFGHFFGLLRKILSAARKGPLGKVASRRERRLRLCESVSFGERRLIALIQLDDQPLLVGITGNSITLLTQPAPCASVVPPASDFREMLRASGVPQ
ncbi:MAG TPA: flagellar biosynthetic protein FliO [Candidatus Acidoferrales bacterium]|nr:flagellar biosynthetic protein FliO [Candidatus Acidoferrales bacterium]